MPTPEFGKADSGSRGRGRYANRGEHVMRRKRGVEQALEEMIGMYDPAAFGAGDFHLSAKREEAGRKLRGGIGERDGAANSSPVADRRMTDMGHGQGDERRVSGNLGRAFGLDVADQRPDLELAIVATDLVQSIKTIDVDQQSG